MNDYLKYIIPLEEYFDRPAKFISNNMIEDYMRDKGLQNNMDFLKALYMNLSL